MSGPLLASSANGTSLLSSTWQLPSVNPAGDNVQLIGWVQCRPNRTIVPPAAGWTLRAVVDDGVDFPPGEIRFGLIDRLVANASGPYHDTVSSSGGTSRWSAAQQAFRSLGGGTPVAATANWNDGLGAGTTADKSVTATFAGGHLATAGRVLIGYAAVTIFDGPNDRVFDWPDGWIVLEQIPAQSVYIGKAEVAYKVAGGGETGAELTSLSDGTTPITSLSLLVAEYPIDPDPDPVVEGIGWDVFAADNLLGAPIATLESAKGRYIRSELNGLGEGGFVINRHVAEATEEILAEGNMVKVHIPDCGEDYLDGFFLGADGDYDLLSVRGGQGDENLTFRGPGALDYLDRARMTPCAFSLESTVPTWTKIWQKSLTNPVGTALDPNDDDYLYVISRDRRVRRIRMADQVVVSTSPPLWSGTDNWAAGLSADPSDTTILWALEAPWLAGSSANTKIRKIRISDWSVLATFDLGSAITHSAIKASTTQLLLSRYSTSSAAHSVYVRSKSDGSVISSGTVTYGGVVQTKANGISVNGSQVALWFSGTKRALISSTSAPRTVTSTISTRTIAAFGGDWFTIAGEDYFAMDSLDADLVWLYQVTDQVPQCVDGSGVFHPEQQKPGALAWRVLVEITHVDRPDQPCPELSYDFTEDEDSNGTPWPTRTSTEEFTWRVGDRAYSDVLARLIPADVIFDLDVNTMTLHAYVASSFGTNRTSATFASGKVRFAQGVNLGVNADLTRRDNRGQPATNIVVAGDNGVYGAAELAGRYVREGFMAVSGPTTEAVLDAIGDDELARERLVSEAAGFETLWANDELAGRYVPKLHYWKGDLVRVHMGSGEFEYDEADLRLYGTLITERDAGWRAAIDLGSAYKLPPPVTGIPGDSTGSSSGAGGGSQPGGSTTVVVNPSLTVSDGGDVTILNATRIEAEGAYSPSPGVAVLPRPASGAETAEELLTDETDPTLVFSPDSDGGVVARAEAPELDHGSLGAAVTFDPADAGRHIGELNDDVTITLPEPTVSRTFMEGIISTGAGGFAVSLAAGAGASVAWDGGTTPALPTDPDVTFRLLFDWVPAIATWIVNLTGSGGAAATVFGTPALTLGTSDSDGATDEAIRRDATIAVFDATAPSTQALGDSAATGSAGVAARRDHKHAMPALSSATPLVESGSGSPGTAIPSSREDHVHPAAPALRYEPHVAYDGTVVLDGNGDPVMVEVA